MATAMATQSHSSTFERVLLNFKSNLSPEEQKDFQSTSLKELKLTILAIQKKQKSSKAMKNLTRIRGFLEAMEAYSKVIDVFVNVHEFVAFIWGPMKFLLQVASTFADAFSALIDAYQRIGETIPLLIQYDVLFQKNPDMRQVLELMYHDIFDFHLQALKYFKGSVWKQLFSATWKQFDSRFGVLLENMRRHQVLVETQGGLVEFEQAKNERLLAERRYNTIQEQEMFHRQTFLHSWLSPANTVDDQERCAEIRSGRFATGRWLLKSDKFRSWFDMGSAPSPILWINGIPGAGSYHKDSLLAH